MIRPLTAALASLLAGACAHTPPATADGGGGATVPATAFTGRVYPGTYRPIAAAPVLIAGATVLVGDGRRLEGADVLLRDGRIAAVGDDLPAPADAVRVDGAGKWVTPGVIDAHSHRGVYPTPATRSHSDGNEMTNPVTSHVWAEHSVSPQDPGFAAALAGGVTTLQVLPGSANLIGGRTVVLKNVAAGTVQAMKFPDAKQGLKIACGENPKRVYGQRGGPATRMGNVAGYRAAFYEAQEYARKRAGSDPGKRDLRLDTLAAAMNGEILVHIHCYRADEMALMMDMAAEFGFRIAAFHHGVEAFKIADRLGAAGICGALWADWWGYKMEAYDSVQENVAIVDRAPNGCAIVHSDSSEGIQRLNQEAAKVIANARRAGMGEIPPEHAIRWLTMNPAKVLGVLDRTGTLEAGKMADVVLWNGNPFSVYAKAEKVWIDGAQLYDRADRALQPKADFLLSQFGGDGGAR